MKGLILTWCLLGTAAAFAAADPASQFVQDTMTRGRQILAMKSDSARLQGMCSLLKQRLGRTEIGANWLGRYAGLARERAAVQRFYQMIPSILLTKAFGGGGHGPYEGGDFRVDPKSHARGGGVYDVGVTVTTGNGKSYSGRAVVRNNKNVFTVVDATYMGFSAVDYMGRDYQDFLQREFNKDPNRSMPVSALIQNIMSEDGYIRCP
jgi:hypothetical protein